MDKEWSVWGNERNIFKLLTHSEGSSVNMLEILLQDKLSFRLIDHQVIPGSEIQPEVQTVLQTTDPIIRRVSAWIYRNELIAYQQLLAPVNVMLESQTEELDGDGEPLEKQIDHLETQRKIVYTGFESSQTASEYLNPIRLPKDMYPVKETHLISSGSVCFVLKELFDAELILRQIRLQFRKEIFM
ncbi:hypothetical protein [Paenibacillus lutrae]|uniref:Chorismate lyase n=1 Tax=Paenibacillus lutrae TaxID=2078573 RepID=A0A7X3FEF7_9BACL|nr:hypothetical protein [Paenibacillus lutrae]MVO98127.1 hypothetical protein [Paenibacillus lutrae]